MMPTEKPRSLSGGPDYFLDECSNPLSWFRSHSAREHLTFKMGLYSVMDMKHTVLTEQYADNKPKYVWDLFLYNTYISFNYIMQDHLEDALEIINETEKILSKLTDHSTDFLDSIKNALYHITLTTKGYVLTKCSLQSTEDSPAAAADSFVALRDMDAANSAALQAVQSAFLARYVNRWCILSKVCLLRAISLNPAEPEWRYMLSCCLTRYRKRLHMSKVLPQEIEAAELAVDLSDSPHYKCHLAKLLHSDDIYYAGSYAQDTLKAMQLIRDIVNDSDDVFTLRRCLKILTKMNKTKRVIDNQIVSLAKTIISKIMNSNNSFVRDSIGHYYMHYEKNIEKAKIYLKMASDGNCFDASIDYVCLLYSQDPGNTDIVRILDGYLNVYQSMSAQHTLLTLIVSYQLLNKNDIVGALTYIDKLLDNKVSIFVRRLQMFKTKFCNPNQKLNLLKVIFNELEKNVDNETLSVENMSFVKQLFEKISEFNTYVDTIRVDTKKTCYDLDLIINFLTQNEIIDDKCCNLTYLNHDKLDKSSAKPKAENWRTLKPNGGPNVFTLNKYRYYDRQYRPMRQNNDE